MDRRKQRTRRNLMKELIILLKEKPLQNITIKELCNQADINRSTFYLHFKDIYELYHKLEEELLEEFQNTLNESIGKNIFLINQVNLLSYPVLKALYEYIKKNAEIYEIILMESNESSFFNRIYEAGRKSYQRVIADDSTESEYYYDLVAGATIGLIKSWIRKGMKESPATMSELTTQFLNKGLVNRHK